MGKIQAVDFERSGVGRGIKIAALVLILTAAAMTTDHVFFVSPSAKTVAPATPIAAATATASVTEPALDGFALPANLRPTAADVAAPAPSF